MDSTTKLSGSLKPPERPKRKIKAVRDYENVLVRNILTAKGKPLVKPTPAPRITALPSDSDDDPMCGTSESLEDEIFKELERASFDEEKLSEALKNFDKILNEYKEEEERQRNATTRPQAISRNKSQESLCTKSIVVPATDKLESTLNKTKSKIPLSRQVLTKSKTCCIIESKCILKKSRSHDGDLSGNCMRAEIAKRSIQTSNLPTKSQWNSKNLEAHKGANKHTLNICPKNLIEHQISKKAFIEKSPIMTSTSTAVKSELGRMPDLLPKINRLPRPEHPVVGNKKDTLKRAKSDWELKLHYGSRIPIKLFCAPANDSAAKQCSESLPTTIIVKAPATRTKSMDIPRGENLNLSATLHYAKVASSCNLSMESCKVIPAAPFSDAPQNLPTLVAVKDASIKCSTTKVCRMVQKVMTEQEYQSDYSDDSGHISNEHDESASSTSNADTLPPFETDKIIDKIEQPGKISGALLKYFDSGHNEVPKLPINSKAKEVNEVRISSGILIKLLSKTNYWLAQMLI